MKRVFGVRTALAGCCWGLTLASGPALAQTPQALPSAIRDDSVRVVGIVRDETNAITLPGTPVEVVGSGQVVYTDVDGRYTLNVTAGRHLIKVALDGYQERTVTVEAGAERVVTVDVGLRMTGIAETVNVTANVIDAETSSAAAQLSLRKNAQVITDNIGSEQMRQNGDSDAGAAMARVTGLSLVDNQYVFVRGLGERYSNTTLAGSVLPTTEPDKKVVPLDLFPAGLIDSVQIAKSYSPDKSAEFAGGLVQVVPLKLPNRPIANVSYGGSFLSTSTGKQIPLSPLGTRDWLGYDGGDRALPGGFPSSKIVRRGVFTPDVGFTPEEITDIGRSLGNQWRPTTSEGAPGQSWDAVFGNRFGNLGLIASVSQGYKEQYVSEQRRFFRVAEGDDLEAVSDYAMQYGTQKAQLGIVANVAYQFSPNHRLSFENFYSHSGSDEGRTFEGTNTENNFLYRNYRLQYIEEGLLSNAVGGEHFFRPLANSRVDWRVNLARANRDEPDLREVLYQAPLPPATPTFVLADESQSGFRMFNTLDDETTDLQANWSMFGNWTGRATQLKFGGSFIDRSRDFSSRRFRFIPIALNKDGAAPIDLRLAPEELYAPANVGGAFRFNEETRPVDAYDGEQQTAAGYGMVDVALGRATRLVAGARVERFKQDVNTFDPFGLFERSITATNEDTDVFPGINLVQSIRPNMNLRVGYSATVNRPEFRELAAFEFTDVVGSRAVRGNPELERALIQNVDARWETFIGARGVIAASAFYKYFDQPIERVVIGGAQPIVTFQNADQARNFGVELEAAYPILPNVFVNANYTFVDSTIELRPDQRTVQTSLERPLAGQSRNLVNLSTEYAARGFSARLLYNFFGDRISDVGSNEAPDVVEQGRGTLDLVVAHRVRNFGLRLNVENLTNARHLFTQGNAEQRFFTLWRTVALSVSYNLF